MRSLFKSEGGKKDILKLYDQKLVDLNINYTSFYINTSFGQTHIIKTGDAANPPLLLIHGSNGCAPIALECYPNLCAKYQVFAVDVLAQPNKSANTRLRMDNDDYGVWVNEIIEELSLEKVTLAGFSFGGLIILKTLAYHAQKIKKAFLASPAYIVNGNPLLALFKVFIPMKRYMKTTRVKYLEKFLNVLFTNRDEFAIQYLSKVFLHFEMDFTPVPTISAKEAKAIDTPIVLIAAQNDLLFPGIKMIKKAKKLFSTLQHTVLLEDSKHVQNEKGNKVVEDLILEG